MIDHRDLLNEHCAILARSRTERSDAESLADADRLDVIDEAMIGTPAENVEGLMAQMLWLTPEHGQDAETFLPPDQLTRFYETLVEGARRHMPSMVPVIRDQSAIVIDRANREHGDIAA